MIKASDRFKKIKIEIIAIIILPIVLGIIGYFLFMGYGIGPIKCGPKGCITGGLYNCFGFLFILLIAAIVSAFYKWRG